MAIPMDVAFPELAKIQAQQRQAVAEHRFATLRVDGYLLTAMLRPRQPSDPPMTFLQGLPADALVVNVVPNPYAEVMHPEFWFTVASMSFDPWQEGQEPNYLDITMQSHYLEVAVAPV